MLLEFPWDIGEYRGKMRIEIPNGGNGSCQVMTKEIRNGKEGEYLNGLLVCDADGNQRLFPNVNSHITGDDVSILLDEMRLKT